MSSYPTWLNVPEAKARIVQINNDVQKMLLEKNTLLRLLGERVEDEQQKPRGVAATATGGGGTAPAPRTSLLSIIEAAMAGAPPERAWTVGELREAVAKTHPERRPQPKDSSLFSSSLAQALKAKHPRFVTVGRGHGRGSPRRYQLAPKSA